jgi:hypothetical protein
MAFTHNIENIIKDTGLSEDELASLIINKENEGLTNDEIVDLLVSISDNKEYASKDQDDQDELQALQSLGLKPASEKQAQDVNDDPGLFDRFAAARAAVANSVKNWRDSHPEQWRVGMVNSIFGDNNMLSQYYAAKQAAEESEKNRESQREYNEYLKEYDRANAEAENRAAYKKELKEAEVEMAKLSRDLVKANASEAAVILKQQKALIAKYPDLTTSNEEAQKAYDEERKYAVKLNKFKGNVKRDFLTDEEKQNEIDRVQAESWISPDDISKIVDDIRSIKPLSRMKQERNLQQDLTRGGEKRGKALDDADLTKKANAAIANNTPPSSLSQAVRDKIREMGTHTWTDNGWSER